MFTAPTTSAVLTVASIEPRRRYASSMTNSSATQPSAGTPEASSSVAETPM